VPVSIMPMATRAKPRLLSEASHADQLALLAHLARDRRDAIGRNDQAGVSSYS